MIGRSDGREDNRNFRLYLIDHGLYIGLLPSRGFAIYCYSVLAGQQQTLSPKTWIRKQGLTTQTNSEF